MGDGWFNRRRLPGERGHNVPRAPEKVTRTEFDSGLRGRKKEREGGPVFTGPECLLWAGLVLSAFHGLS